MKSFTTEILLNGIIYQFTFRKIRKSQSISYYVETVTNLDMKFGFMMEQTGMGWRIINEPKLPDTIISLQQVSQILLMK